MSKIANSGLTHSGNECFVSIYLKTLGITLGWVKTANTMPHMPIH